MGGHYANHVKKGPLSRFYGTLVGYRRTRRQEQELRLVLCETPCAMCGRVVQPGERYSIEVDERRGRRAVYCSEHMDLGLRLGRSKGEPSGGA